MITKRDINRLREMVRFELSKEIKKGVSRLVTNVRQRKNSEFRISICSAPVLHSTKGVVHVNEKTLETFGNCEDKHGLPFQIFVTVFFAYSFIIPPIFMGVVYGRIISVLWSRARNKIINKNMAKVKIRVVKMMVLIVITYFITWGPKLILKIMEAFLSTNYVSEEDENEGSTGGMELDSTVLIFLFIEPISTTFSLTSSILNPLIFAYYNKAFREDLQDIFCGKSKVDCCKKKFQRSPFFSNY